MEIKLNDFYQAVVLKTVGLQLLRLERGAGKFSIFVFADPESKADDIIRKYWGHEINVDAKAIVDNINELKTRIYSGV